MEAAEADWFLEDLKKDMAVVVVWAMVAVEAGSCCLLLFVCGEKKQSRGS